MEKSKSQFLWHLQVWLGKSPLFEIGSLESEETAVFWVLWSPGWDLRMHLNEVNGTRTLTASCKIFSCISPNSTLHLGKGLVLCNVWSRTWIQIYIVWVGLVARERERLYWEFQLGNKEGKYDSASLATCITWEVIRIFRQVYGCNNNNNRITILLQAGPCYRLEEALEPNKWFLNFLLMMPWYFFPSISCACLQKYFFGYFRQAY